MTQPWHSVARFLAALVGGALLLLIVLFGYYRLSAGLTAPALQFQGLDLRIVEGAGHATDKGAEIAKSSARGIVMIQVPVRPFEAKRYAGLAWRLSGLKDTLDLRVIWAARGGRGKPQDRTVSDPNRARGVLSLEGDPAWDGEIIALGLVIVGPLTEPLTLHGLSLEPRTPTASQILEAIRDDWLRVEPWSGRSINFDDTGPPNGHLPLTLQAALWAICSGLIYMALSRSRRGHAHLVPYVLIAISAWSILDLRWAWVLLQRADQTIERYAGLDGDQRQQVGPDQGFFPFLQQIKNHIQPPSARLFVVSPEPGSYGVERARYHLFPANSYATQALDCGMNVEAGDYILMMEPLRQIPYARQDQRLIFGDCRIPARLELSDPSLGGLFVVKDGV